MALAVVPSLEGWTRDARTEGDGATTDRFACEAGSDRRTRSMYGRSSEIASWARTGMDTEPTITMTVATVEDSRRIDHFFLSPDETVYRERSPA